MTGDAIRDPVIIRIAVEDPGLARRLADLLADVPGIRLAADGDVGDATLMASRSRDGPGGIDPPLTQRERSVLLLLAEGASNKEIARRLGISPHTAKFHVGQLLEKLDASGRTDAVAHAVRLGVIRL